jgi:preprotein translocase subunit SecB
MTNELLGIEAIDILVPFKRSDCIVLTSEVDQHPSFDLSCIDYNQLMTLWCSE